VEREEIVMGALCNDPVSRAVEMCREENFLEALTLLQEDIPLEQHSKITRRLQSKIQKSAEERSTFTEFVTRSTSHEDRSVPSSARIVRHSSRHDLSRTLTFRLVRAPQAVATTGLYAMGLVHFEGPDESLMPFVDRVHDFAKVSYAGVHSFIGDTVVVTWNAVRRAASFEPKALQFFLKLRDDAGGVRAYGAVMSGAGRYQMAGGALQAPLLHVDWFQQLEALAALGASHDAVLTSRRLYEQAQCFIEARSVDLLLLGEETVEVFEVLSARTENENEVKEWMYRLEDQGPLCNDPVSRAVVMCRKGRFLEALTLLQEQCPLAKHSKMTRRLQSKVQRSVEKCFTLADFVSCCEDGTSDVSLLRDHEELHAPHSKLHALDL